MDDGILVTLMCFGAGIAAWVAASKQRNVIGWLIGGALFPVIAVIAVCCLPPLRSNPHALRAGHGPADGSRGPAAPQR